MTSANAELLRRFGFGDYDAYTTAQRDRSLVNIRHDPTRRVTHLASLLESFASDRDSILCVGCRNTHELDVLEQRGWTRAIGVDLHNKADDRIRVMDMHDLGFDTDRFSAVFASHVFEHSLDPQRVAREFVRVVVPGGLIAIEVPILYGGRGADLWDFESSDGVAAYFPTCAMEHAEHGAQLDADQQVARIVLRTPA